MSLIIKQFSIVFLLGALSALSMAPVNAWPVLFLGLGGLYVYVVRAPSALKAALLAYGFGLGYFGFGLFWIGNALLVEGNPYWWAWPLAVSGLPVILSFFGALACFCFKRFFSGLHIVTGYILFCLLLGGGDLARGTLFTGFPWNLYGYTWISVLPIAQLAGLYNVYVLNFITIFWAVAPAFLIISKLSKSIKSVCVVCLVFSFAGGYGFGAYKIQMVDQKGVGDKEYGFVVVQPNIKQSDKWDPKKRPLHFVDMVALSKSAAREEEKKTTYIIWPETAIGQDVLDAPWALDEIRKMLNEYKGKAYLITGALRHNKDKDTYYNSVIVVDGSGRVTETYDKSHLVPFGEYIPFGNILDIAPVVGFKGFERGGGIRALSVDESAYFLPLICYEIIFPQKYVQKTTQKIDFVVNVTNDAWYGNSPGPYQHLVQTQFRAIENRVPIIRAANTGVSAIIAPTGALTRIAPLFSHQALSENISL